MNESTRLQLEKKLKKMLTHLEQTETKPSRPKASKRTGNFILRRAGNKEKRFSMKP
jgi:hypothetical protein